MRSRLAVPAILFVASLGEAAAAPAPTLPPGEPVPAEAVVEVPPPVAVPAPAPAPDVVAPHAAGAELQAAGTTSSPRGAALDWLVMPTGYDLGATLRYVTADAALSARPLRFTDLGLLDLQARGGLGHGVEVSLGTTLVPKQPSDADEPIWQGASLGVRYQPRGHGFVLGASGGGGPMLDELGLWTQGGLAISSRKRLVGGPRGGLQLEGSAGGLGTWLVPSTGPVTHLAEAYATGGILVHGGERGPQGGGGAAWISAGYARPVWHRGDDPVSAVELDPQPRLDFALGAMATMLDRWDLIVELRVTDRGDAPFPATRLPILDGGFDQVTLAFGLTRHAAWPSPKPASRDVLIVIP